MLKKNTHTQTKRAVEMRNEQSVQAQRKVVNWCCGLTVYFSSVLSYMQG